MTERWWGVGVRLVALTLSFIAVSFFKSEFFLPRLGTAIWASVFISVNMTPYMDILTLKMVVN